MGRNQQMMRLDHEHTNDINAAEEAQLFKNFCAYVESEKPSLIILEDYNKGVLTAGLIQSVIDYCNQKRDTYGSRSKTKKLLGF